MKIVSSFECNFILSGDFHLSNLHRALGHSLVSEDAAGE